MLKALVHHERNVSSSGVSLCCSDEQVGGYFTCLDRDGTVLDESKYQWLQGRSVWSFSRLYNELNASDPRSAVTEAMRDEWFEAAKMGADFLHKVRACRSLSHLDAPAACLARAPGPHKSILPPHLTAELGTNR